MATMLGKEFPKIALIEKNSSGGIELKVPYVGGFVPVDRENQPKQLLPGEYNRGEYICILVDNGSPQAAMEGITQVLANIAQYHRLVSLTEVGRCLNLMGVPNIYPTEVRLFSPGSPIHY